VKATNSCGEGSLSSPDNGTRQTTPSQAALLSPPDGTIIVSGSTQNFCWNTVPNTTQYRLQWDNESSFSPPCEEQTTVNTCAARLMNGSGVIYWRVQAENLCGAGTWSSYLHVLVEPSVNFLISSTYAGCSGPCRADTLYVNFTGIDYYSGQLILQLPTGLAPDWSGVLDVRPAPSLRTANLSLSFAQGLPSNQVEVNVLWGPHPDRSVDDGLYCAAIPVRATSMTHADTLRVTHVSYLFMDADGEHASGFTFNPTYAIVDCQAPVVALSGGTGEPSCNAYNNAGDFADALTYSVTAGASPNSAVDHAYMVINSQQFTLTAFAGTWPAIGDAAAVWNAMTEGCNTFVLHGLDAECNEGIIALGNIIKDVTPPTAVATMTQTFCYNNEPTSPQYGAGLIASDLDINATVGSGPCIASTGDLQLAYGANQYPTTALVLPLTTWPGCG
jgi:hypothetical protein